MQELIGQIAATIIGGIIILTLAVIAWRGQRASMDAAQYEAAKQGTVDLARALELDLNNMGAGLANGSAASTVAARAVIDFDTTSATRVFEFWTQTDSSQSTAGDTVLVKYEWTQQGTVTVRLPSNAFTTTPAYAVERYVDVGSGYTLDGQSSDVLTTFSLDFRTNAGASVDPAVSSATVREIEVVVRAVSPLGGGTAPLGEDNTQFIDQTRWSRVFRPVNLTRVPI